MRVVFLDRDGVINYNRDDYVKSAGEFEFLPGALDALRMLHIDGWKVIVISNQAGVGKGLISQKDLDGINDKMNKSVEAAGGAISGIYYCIHTPNDDCDCRKPKPGLIIIAGNEIGFDPKDAVLVGDHAGDMMAGRAAGCRTVMVLSGRTSAETASAANPAPDYIAADLKEAAQWIISKGN